ncbi:ABC transporter permease [Secundilactobacillus kimchicus]|uniref:ABC transporter permease n=1 Tax=Secundilactobacillus kimchicus TaxID=528209 RepID=UPI0024A85891|nr:FtsX-like permease family protein [Secundilactobacillus kimchicus]
MKPLTKNMWREIGQSKGRFIAIVLIIMLGVLIFVGVKAAGPALNDSASKTVTDAHLSDVQVLSTTGFTQQDVAAVKQVPGAQVEAVNFKYAVGGKTDDTVAVYGDDRTLSQNQLTIVSGHRPRHANEIVLDNQAKTQYHYRLGQLYRFSREAGLKQRQYKIVGFANSPRYLDNTQRGSANVGDGTVRYFAVVPKQQMGLKVATMLTIRFKALQNKQTFSRAYRHAVADKLAALKRQLAPQAKRRETALLRPIEARLNQMQAKLKAAAVTGAMPASVIARQQSRLAAQRRVAKAKATTTYTWQTRDDLPGLQAYGESSERIAAIANVFPVFFFLIAALITFTTITRMVEEARSQIGTFKALGYTRWAIARNYLLYALTAGVLGTVLGAMIGNITLPRIVLSLYKMYIPLTVVDDFQWGVILLAALFSLLATVGAAALVVRRQLSEGPATLMRPKSPKSANRILMERITPLWQRLSFNQKVSYRNLFRFKSRMLMTIIGIAGGTALILTGFGIRDSINATSRLQYSRVSHYQAVVRLNSEAGSKAATKTLAQHAQYKRRALVAMDNAKVSAHQQQVTDVSVTVPKSVRSFNDYVKLTGRNVANRGTLPTNGVLLTSKMAKLLRVSRGDRVTIRLAAGTTRRVRVAGVAENYVAHTVYLTPSVFRSTFQQAPVYNTLLVQLRAQTAAQQKQLANDLLKSGTVAGTSYTKDQEKTIQTMSASLTGVVAIFVLLSGVLSFVVLYNLTNINVSERIRELSTIKVLGFFDREVTMYIVRENVVMTLLGIVVGYGLGWLLTLYIMQQAAAAFVIFPVTIHWPGFAAATGLMLLFTAVVMAVTHRRLKRIDMIGALSAKE